MTSDHDDRQRISTDGHSDGDGPPGDDARGPDRRGDLDDTTLGALGKLIEATELVERARGHLYAFHQLTGHADLTLGDAADGFRAAGHDEVGDRIDHELVGLNVLPGRWSFQLVEEYDDGYWTAVRAAERDARTTLAEGRRHTFEAAMKEQRRTAGRPGHESRPDPPHRAPR